MTDRSEPIVPILDGVSGLPFRLGDEPGPQRGSIDWLLTTVEQHERAEAGALEQYEELATSSGDPVVSLVMRLILEDEQRHHGLLKQIEASLRDALEWTHSPNALPTSIAPQEPLRRDLGQVARELVDEERTGAWKMRELARQERQVAGGLHTLLLDMMAADSDKHAHLLQYVADRLSRRGTLADGPAD